MLNKEQVREIVEDLNAGKRGIDVARKFNVSPAAISDIRRGKTHIDVTGGMLGKVSEAREAVKEGVEVQFVNASKPDVILKALKRDLVAGTILTG